MTDYKEKFEKMRVAGKLASKTLDMLTDYIKPGVSTDKIDKLGYEFIRDHGGYSAPLFYRGFEKSLCTSLNHVVCHGIPSDRILEDGDAVIYRSKLSNTIFSSRQLINHGHVKVNGKKVNISSYQVKEEDNIEIRDKSKQLALIDIALANKEREVPEYLQLDEKNKKVKFVRIPKFEEVPYPVTMEPNLVIEYYSR